MIIDCHGHYTTAPKQLQDYRDAQIAALKQPTRASERGTITISDDELRQSVKQIRYISDPSAGEIRLGCTQPLALGFASVLIERFAPAWLLIG